MFNVECANSNVSHFFQSGANYVKRINGVFRFDVKNKDNKKAVWIIDVKNGNGSVSTDENCKSDNYILAFRMR